MNKKLQEYLEHLGSLGCVTRRDIFRMGRIVPSDIELNLQVCKDEVRSHVSTLKWMRNKKIGETIPLSTFAAVDTNFTKATLVCFKETYMGKMPLFKADNGVKYGINRRKIIIF